MQVTFPAMRGRIGGREYFATIMALSEIPRFFKFNDWEQCTPELRAQRVLNEGRVPVIAKYILETRTAISSPRSLLRTPLTSPSRPSRKPLPMWVRSNSTSRAWSS